MNAFRDYLVSLKSAVDNGAESSETRTIVRNTLRGVSTQGDSNPMWELARQAVGYVMDVAVNQGTNEDMWELRRCLEDSGSDYSPQPDNDEAIRLIGALYNHNYRPESIEIAETPLDDIMAEWCNEIGYSAVQAVLAYVEESEPDSD